MAFQKKTWLDRLTEFATRRTITNLDTSEVSIVEVARSEGTVYQQGDAFSAANMNDLEDRIDSEFTNVSASLTEVLEVTTLQTDTWGQVATKIYAALSNITMTRPPRLELITYDNTQRLFDAATYGAHYLHAISSETINDGTQNVLRMFDFNIASSPAFRSVLITNSATSISDRTNTTAGVVKAKVYY